MRIQVQAPEPLFSVLACSWAPWNRGNELIPQPGGKALPVFTEHKCGGWGWNGQCS